MYILFITCSDAWYILDLRFWFGHIPTICTHASILGPSLYCHQSSGSYFSSSTQKTPQDLTVFELLLCTCPCVFHSVKVGQCFLSSQLVLNGLVPWPVCQTWSSQLGEHRRGEQCEALKFLYPLSAKSMSCSTMPLCSNRNTNIKTHTKVSKSHMRLTGWQIFVLLCKIKNTFYLFTVPSGLLEERFAFFYRLITKCIMAQHLHAQVCDRPHKHLSCH